MSIRLQIAIPLLVTFAALLAIAIWRKYFKPETAVIGTAVLGFGVCMLVMHFLSVGDAPRMQGQTISDEDMVSLVVAEQYMMQDEYDEAITVLADLRRENGDDQQVLLATARCALLSGRYVESVQLYSQMKQPVEEEQGLASVLAGADLFGDDAIITYLSKNTIDPSGYGLTQAAVVSDSYDKARNKIRAAINDHLDEFEAAYGEEALKAARYAAKITTLFTDYVGETMSAEGEDITNPVASLNAVMTERPELASNVHLRVARLKGYVLSGDFQKIAKVADRDVSAQEMVILTEMYVNGLIKSSDFSQAYVDLDDTLSESVLNTCRDILDKNKDVLTKGEYDRYQEKLGIIEDQMKHPVVFTLRYDLLKQAQEGSEALRSKCFLALAKLEQYSGNTQDADKYISDALGTAASSDDENYRIPMTQLAGVVQGTVESEEIKNVADYVDQALNHSLPLQVEATEIPQSQPEDDISLDEGGTATDGEQTEEEKNETFGEHMTGEITKSTATINIGLINKDNFPEVKARVQIQSDEWTTIEDLQKYLKVYDCGSEITEFKLEKLEFQKSRIILLCDVSGSMSGSVDDLKNAVVSFAENMREGEEVCVIGFDSDIVFMENFSDDPDVVAGYADQIGAYGGTALFDALLEAGELHTQDINGNNIIIAMTDGQDGNSASDSEMYNRIGAMAAQKGVTVYTVGLGSSVDADYLETMAESGNGSFLYVRTEEELEDFYDFIHNQLSNQYILTYIAKNKVTNNRKLEVSVEGELGSAQKQYYLQDPDYSDEDTDSYNPYTVVDSELTVSGFTTKFLYKSSQTQILMLHGSGFADGDDVTVRITDNVKYALEATYVDASAYQITIPPEISVGTYDLDISIRGESFTLNDELTIAVQGNEKNFRFGSYNFTALNSYVNDSGQTVLSGNVVMNGWLHFKGDVAIDAGYADSEKAWITDNSGAYISYMPSTATGLAKYLSEKGVPISFDAFGKFSISNDPYTPSEYADFSVDPISAVCGIDMLFIEVKDYSMSLYPDMLHFQGLNFNIDLPFQSHMMQGFDKSMSADAEMMLTATKISFVGKASADVEGADFTMVSLPLSLDSFSLEVDTLRNNFAVEASVGFKAIKGMKGIDFGLGIVDGKFDSISLQTDGPEARLMDSPVPVSIADFGFALSGFSQQESDDSLLSRVLATTITSQFTVNVASLNAYLPEIAEVINDEDEVALASLDNCELSLTLKEFRLAFTADLKLCTVLDIGKCRITMGKFNYTNELIGYVDETQYGLQAALTIGTSWKTDNLKMDISGTSEVTIGYPYSGLWLNGDVDFDIGWWIFSAEVDVSGDVLVGAYINSTDNLQFSVIARGTKSNGRYTGFHLYVTRPEGFEIHKY